mgnify:CR=1 FL=1
MKKIIGLTCFLVALLFVVAGCAQQVTEEQGATLTAEEQAKGVKLTDDGVKYTIHWSKFINVNWEYIEEPEDLFELKDVQPAINSPQFESVAEADTWLADEDQVQIFTHNGVERAYPIKIQNFHGAINDVVGGTPVLLSWCPLCAAGIVYERTVAGQPLTFFYSGLVYNSNTVFFDEETLSIWPQVGGTAVYGEHTGAVLNVLESDVVDWGTWKTAHPDSEVLSRNTGFDYDYTVDNFEGYHAMPTLFFPIENADKRAGNKVVVFGVTVNGVKKAYLESDVDELGTIEDTVGGVSIEVTKDAEGQVRVEDVATGEQITKKRTYWFTWIAEFPESDLYGS